VSDVRARRVFAATARCVLAGIVYHLAIRAFLHLDSWGLAADHLLHTVVPVLAVYGWVRYGPRRLTSATVARLTELFPLTWFVFTLVRGWFVDGYPSTFIDARPARAAPEPVAPRPARTRPGPRCPRRC
jgi:hypothetical protein